MGKRVNSLSALRSLGKSFNCLSASESVSSEYKNSNDVLQFTHLDVSEADKVVEKILDEDDCSNVFFVAPLNCHRLVEDEDEDGDEYWSKMKPIMIERISRLLGLKYGIDFAILRRGVFSLLVFLTKDGDGEWFLPREIRDFIVPDSPDVFIRTLDYYYKNTDSEFFPINAITATDKDCGIGGYSVKEGKNVSIEGIQVDITFLRSDSFKMTDSEEERVHFTYHVFMEGIMHAIAMEHRILSFDDEEVDELLSKIADKACYRRES